MLAVAEKMAKAIIKNALGKREAQCHNDKWTETYCVHCQATNYNGDLKHKNNCIVNEAKKFLENSES